MNLFKKKFKITFADDSIGHIFIGPSQKETRVDFTYNIKTNKLHVFVDGELVKNVSYYYLKLNS